MNRRRLLFLCLSVVMMVLSLFPTSTPKSVRAIGLEIFVSPSGTGVDCTQAAPCQATQGISNAVVGSTIYFAQGTYTSTGYEVLTLDKDVSLWGGWDGVGTGPVNIDPDAYPTIFDGEETRNLLVIDNSSGYPMSVRGFTFQNGKAVFPISMGGAIHVSNGLVIIEDNHFVNNYADDYGGAIYVEPAYNVEIKGNTFINNEAKYGGGGIFISLDDPQDVSATVEGNIFDGNDAEYGTAIHVSNSSVWFAGNLVKDDLNGLSAVSISSTGPSSTIVNNYILRANQNAIDISNSSEMPHQILHNTIVNATYGLMTWADVKANIVNNIFTDSIYSIRVSGESELTGSHNLIYEIDNYDALLDHPLIEFDPMFVDPSIDDYHLQKGSPAQDAGAYILIKLDYDGDIRPQGDGFDIGADEIISDYFLYLSLILR